eukprot:CAMPEP_0181288908 /NCGR_PEP_ID=MMETSP1101-20121128/597_1 /TAXON_ID=46948 /ORGANISM="Rhodomonas abbreviata, Strain Caron Lab Isolate" /LENGTH=59 /DNA_ID=CAMNT_0023393089 /DNA_START=48 /DNA_END=227 /DNA_ORIENTATION=-
MHSILWNAALPAKKAGGQEYFYAGVHGPSDPSYRDDPTVVTGEKKMISSHGSDMSAIFG